MVSEKEKFLGNLMKGFDFLSLLVTFPIAYFLDEYIRAAAQLHIKAYAIGPTVSGFIFFATNYWQMFIGFPLIWCSFSSYPASLLKSKGTAPVFPADLCEDIFSL